jgi:hypothetical protein
MSDDYPGFDDWDPTDADHPFPFDEIEVRWGNDRSAKVQVDFLLPQSQPGAKTVAVRYAGVEKSTQLWFALECTRGADGTPACQLVLRARHFHWEKDHGESGPGPVQEIRPPMDNIGIAGGHQEIFAAHGPHCDGFDAWWYFWQGKIRCELWVVHYQFSLQAMLDARAKANREAERGVPRVIELPPWPVPPEEDEPKPKPEPLPEGSMAPERPGGLLGGLLALLRRIGKAIFG